MPGTLFLVATPIGNLDDMSFRAVQTLREVDRIACEDTRQTRKLLEKFQITTPLVSFHEHNEKERAPKFAEQLLAGQSIALVSDAGTPLVSDPGFRLVEAAISAGIGVVPIPGPSAVLAALTASGLASHAFRFAGFLSAKRTQRRKELERHPSDEATAIFFEAPHRILETLEDIEEILGPATPVVVARELTKLHEEFLRGTVAEVRAELADRPAVKGEITLLVGKNTKQSQSVAEADLAAELKQLLSQGLTRMEALKALARRHGLPKRELYKRLEGLGDSAP
ncbi:MAG: 16S rRNA (cytidine(1402)-2'-O)-methyltransferase [Acidimicrobiia bacterium]|nr:16S rRNA (cytidine(1402)-2'-O)-methyltransferase [Acidimicrobiia bacterium]